MIGAIVGHPSPRAAAQDCAGQWLPGEGYKGVDLKLNCSCLWDPDGPGPRAPVLVVGGIFNYAGATRARNIAILDNGVWSALGEGTNATVRALAVLPTGELVAAGWFTEAGGQSVGHIAKWDGHSWSPLGAGMPYGTVESLTVTTSGALAAGGFFEHAGEVDASGVALWDGQSWSALGPGLGGEYTGGGVYAVAAMSNGDLIAGGKFTIAGGSPASRIARWNGGSWSAMGNPQVSDVYSIIEMPGGDVVAGGYGLITRWNGAAWSSLGTYFVGTGNALALSPAGELIAAGIGSMNGVVFRQIARWDGAAWQPFAQGFDGGVYTVAFLPDGRLFAGGDFTRPWNSPFLDNAAVWDGAAWGPLWAGIPAANNTVHALTVLPNGDVVSGGEFTVAGGVNASFIARWDGSLWNPMGPGLSDDVLSLATLPNGNVIAGGYFKVAGTLAVNGIARWDGAAWNKLGGGVNGSGVYATLVLPNGDLIVAGEFIRAANVQGTANVARWDGTSWKAMGTGLPTITHALALRPNGDIVAGGRFGDVRRWNGTSWVSTGGSFDGNVYALAALPNGDVVAGGEFVKSGTTEVNYIARWNGSSWLPMEGGMDRWVFALRTLPGGDLIVGGAFYWAGGVGATAANHIARWNGSTWSKFGSGVDYTPTGYSPYTRAIADHPSGELVVGGGFGEAGNVPSLYFARWSPSGVPWISRPPDSVEADPGEFITLTAAIPDGYSNLTYRWHRNGAPVSDGAGGASAGGGTVAGASGHFSSPTRIASATLTISGVQPSDEGAYTLNLTNSCGTSASVPASVFVGCFADYDNSGVVDEADLAEFLEAFIAGDPAADVDHNLFTNGDDFDAFMERYLGGC